MSEDIRKMIDKVKNFKQFVNEDAEILNNYMLGNVTINFLKKQINYFHSVDSKDTEKRKNLLSNRKSDIKIEEYQNLFDYWNFCDKNEGKLDLGYNDIGAYKSIISSWVWYLTMCQLFPNELKHTTGKGNTESKLDLYTKQYEQILNLPKLSGVLEEDEKIFYNVLRNEFNASHSPVRNGIILYFIYYKGNDRLF